MSDDVKILFLFIFPLNQARTKNLFWQMELPVTEIKNFEGKFPGGPVVRTWVLSMPWLWVQSLVGETKIPHASKGSQKSFKKVDFIL